MALSYDPPHHQLFCCSLLQPLQLPPPAMSSSSSALFFPRSRTSADSVVVTVAASMVDSHRAEVANAESEFAFLESKPSLLGQRVAKGKAAGKGRRHAGEAILRRKLANQAFLVKIGGKELGGGKSGGSGGGHRRRGRILSELVADQFAPNVPYSLNRKSRWAEDGADWLSELAGGWTGPKLRLSLAEADYSLVGTETVRALHRLDTDRGRAESRRAKSGRGAMLADLARPKDEAEEENEEPPVEEMHFQLTRPHAVSNVFAGKFFKRKQLVRSTKCTGIETSGPPPAGPLINRGAPHTESEPDEENEFLAQYRPRRETYSLADFVRDAAPSPPVIIRRPNKSSNGCGGDGQFAVVPELECLELPDLLVEHPIASVKPESNQQCPAMVELRQRLSCPAPIGFFRQFPLALAISGSAQIQALANWHQWNMKWLGENLLEIDLSWALAKQPPEQTLVLVLSPGEILVNSLIQLNEQKLFQALESGEGLKQKIKAMLEAVRADFAEWDLGRQRQQNAACPEHLRAVFHSQRMATALHPFSVQTILAHQRAEQEREESQFVGAEELLVREEKGDHGGTEVDGEEEEEFELIDINELLGGAAGGGQPGSAPDSLLPKLSAPKCADCSKSTSSSSMPLAMLRSCGHQICRACLCAGLEQQMKTATRLHCSICPAQLTFDTLPWLLPLPVANALILLHHGDQMVQAGHQLAQCPGCHAILDVGQQTPEFGQICCIRCSLHWCPKCERAPHWPLSCGQDEEWTHRSSKGDDAEGNLVANQKVVVKASGQQISGQFAEICFEARTRRMDARLGWQLGKHMRRLSDSRSERCFVLARKTALHLLEFGTAWLYLNRHQRPPAWSQLKSLIWALRERTECLDNELLFSGSLTDPTTLKAKLGDLEELAEKGLAKFGAV